MAAAKIVGDTIWLGPMRQVEQRSGQAVPDEASALSISQSSKSGGKPAVDVVGWLFWWLFPAFNEMINGQAMNKATAGPSQPARVMNTIDERPKDSFGELHNTADYPLSA
jgi:hypothetical protein